VTVVDYSKNTNELADAIEQARTAMKAKGAVKYDGVNNLDGHRSWRITVETADCAHSRRNPDRSEQPRLHRGRRDADQCAAVGAVSGFDPNPE
jgi:hypothetical protein